MFYRIGCIAGWGACLILAGPHPILYILLKTKGKLPPLRYHDFLLLANFAMRGYDNYK